jgi:WD40 repeat protein
MTAHAIAFNSDGSEVGVGSSTNVFDGSTTVLLMYKEAENQLRFKDNLWNNYNSAGRGVAFDPNNNYMVIIHTEFPFMTIFKQTDGELNKIPNPDFVPMNEPRSVKFSFDGKYLGVTSSLSAPGFTVWKVDSENDTFTKISNSTIQPVGPVRDVAFGVDNKYVAVTHELAPFLSIYKFEDDVMTKLPNPNDLPTAQCRGCDFSDDGKFLAVQQSALSPWLVIYAIRDNDVFERLPNVTTLPSVSTSGATKIKFSPGSRYMAYASDTAPFVVVWRIDGERFTRLDSHADLIGAQVEDVAWSHDGKYLLAAHQGSPMVTFYKEENQVFTRIPPPSVLPIGTGRGVGASEDGMLAFVSSTSQPFGRMYRTRSSNVITPVDLTEISFKADKGSRFKGVGFSRENSIKGRSSTMDVVIVNAM